jgi:hypothetical protein
VEAQAMLTETKDRQTFKGAHQRIDQAGKLFQKMRQRIELLESQLETIAERHSIQIEALNEEINALWMHINKSESQTQCEKCGKHFRARRSDARFCSDRCRKAANRMNRK